jgi:hypothetical protein
MVTKVVLEEVVVVAVLLEGPVKVDDDEVVVAVVIEDVLELVELLDNDKELDNEVDDEELDNEVDDEELDNDVDEEIEELLMEYVVVLPCQATTPSLAYKLNCWAPPHFAVPVVAAPIEPLQTSVQAFAPVKLVTEEEPKLKTLPP